MKKLLICVAMCTVLVLVAACSSSNKDVSSSDSAVVGSASSQSSALSEQASQSVSSGAHEHQIYPELSSTVYLKDSETRMSVAYDSPAHASSGGRTQYGHFDKGAMWLAFSWQSYASEEQPTGKALFDVCMERNDFDLPFIDEGDEVALDVSTTDIVNGWNVEFFEGRIKGANNDSRSLAMYVVHHDSDVVWCFALDDSDSGQDESELASLLEKVVHTFRDYEG